MKLPLKRYEADGLNHLSELDSYTIPDDISVQAERALCLGRDVAELENAYAGLLCGWQPIETAPKDGTKILLLFDDIAVEGSFMPKTTFTGESWDTTIGCCDCFCLSPTPTHWMPLPPPPES